MPDITEELSEHLERQYGLLRAPLSKLSGGVMNSNFHYATPSEDLVIKVYETKTPEEVGFEVEVLNHVKTSGFKAPVPRLTQEGENVSVWKGKPVLVYGRLSGRPLREVDDAMLVSVGSCIGNLHRATEGFQPRFSKRTWDPADLPALIEDRGRVLAEKGFSGAQQLLDFVREELAKQKSFDELPKGITHQDVKPENILVEGSEITGLIDFDNSYYGILLNDLTTAALWICFDEAFNCTERLSHLIRGYELKRPLTAEERSSLLPLLKWRLLREMIIPPLVTPGNVALVSERVEHFKKLYTAFDLTHGNLSV